MKPTGNASHAFSSLTLLLSAGLFSLAGCSSTHAAQQGIGGSGFADTTAQSGEAIAQAPECHQTDSTDSCCLKQHPGDYERCGATPPTQKPNQPNRLPPPGTVEDKSADAKERARRKELCGDYYTRCIQQRGGRHRAWAMGIHSMSIVLGGVQESWILARGMERQTMSRR
jgi:hypothetical protein